MPRPVRLALTAGDPAGIGPEIVARALAEGRLPRATYTVYTEASRFAQACAQVGIDAAGDDRFRVVPISAGDPPAEFRPGAPSAYTGRIAAESLEAATRDVLAGHADALVTAPLAKSALREAGVSHPGHTEYLAALTGVDAVAMMFVAGPLRLTLATIHVPLADVPASITVEGISTVVRLTRECLVARASIANPSIAVLGVNPHAGEGGLFGDEETRVLEPTIASLVGRGWAVEGPFPADSFFLRRARDFDAVIAMYHDQGLVPVKLLSDGKAVNVTLGLPFLRTSVDHGTAFDLAGTGRASADSLVAAIELAANWSAGSGTVRPRSERA
jgi:4-hydroxythreonine-4-phosphate dehydrogenase